MSEITTFMQFIYPDEDSDPYWNDFQSFTQLIDAAAFMAKIQNNLFTAGGGNITLSGDTLSWTADFVIPIFHYGRRVLLRFGTDGLTRQAIVPDGAALVAELPYAMSNDVVINMSVLTTLTPSAHEQWVMGWRSGSNIYIKGMGKVI